MSDSPTLEELLEIQEHFGLPSTELAEKDWYVVKALAAIEAADTTPFRLIFGGGTALARAYGLLQRMSEDIDLRITGVERPSRGQLHKLRTTITEALLEAGFHVRSREAGAPQDDVRGALHGLPTSLRGDGEGKRGATTHDKDRDGGLSVAARRGRPAGLLFRRRGLFRPPESQRSPARPFFETAADKLVALTRRAGAELAGLREKRDPTLVRHIHDLHAIRGHYDADDVAKLARETMDAEAATRAEDFPAYTADPQAETLKAIDGIAASADYAANFATFRRDMVYGDGADFETAVATSRNWRAFAKT